MLPSIAWLIRPGPPAILFALRLVIAVSLALYLSMVLELGRPFWAGLEVALMIQLLPGDTVARAAARVAGTVVAGIAALVILALFQQTPALMIVALACWVSACAFGLQFFRNNMSHAFGVVGFITGVITMFTVSSVSDGSPFDVAQSRVAECCVAAVVVAVVNVIFSSGVTARRYYAQRLDALKAVGAEMQSVIAAARRASAPEREPPENPHARLATLARQVLALEQMRPYIRYEQPAFTAFDRLAQRVDRDLLSLTSALSSLHVYIARHGPGLNTRPLETLAPAIDALATMDEAPARVQARFNRAHETLSELAHADLGRDTPQGLDDRLVLGRARELADRARSILARHALLVAEDRPRDTPAAPVSPGFSWPVNWPRVIRNSLASLVAILVAGTLWLHFHDQTMTIIVVALGGAIATLFSATPSPLASAANFAKGAAIATLASFIINFFWVPMANGYVTYIVLTAPVLFVAGLAMSEPRLALAARISVVIFELTLHTQNDVRIDLPTFFQFALGVYGAVAVAMLAFALLIERDAHRQLRHQVRDIFKELARGLHGSRERFESRIYDRLSQLALLDGEGRHPDNVHQAVLAAINLVLEARRLRVYIARATLEPPLADQARDAIDAIEHGLRDRWRHDDIHALEQRLHALTDGLDIAFRDAPRLATRRLIGRAATSARLTATALADFQDAAIEAPETAVTGPAHA